MNLRKRSRRRWVRRALLGLVGLVMVSAIANLFQLRAAAARPVDAYLVLGGSIRREIYMAEQAIEVPILISSGSADPCIRILFERTGAPLSQVWLEKCARSTLGNYAFGLPILQRWRARHVRLVTSASHLPRALWMAQILLGAHGIWVEPDLVTEQGVPGNQESPFKTGLDLARSLGWAIVSQIYQPDCAQVVRLSDVSLADWQAQGFVCEHQGDIES
ncbi:YdcF family protein [Romeria aff. gracilis LEGE 07310]|uniref:YdcF family protein n=1 Tax=Vasconcelosia minhoensis LEGE 07310 TaxID=915328 RepID=A0A8J7DC33_9CYAN|nr:YdcF family protein [Romeria gracilis]MBE9078487.1 YdcF family protein [Romeria aff. gracilis LEGE 07310]